MKVSKLVIAFAANSMCNETAYSFVSAKVVLSEYGYRYPEYSKALESKFAIASNVYRTRMPGE